MNATNTRITPLHSTFFNLSEIEREFDEGISALLSIARDEHLDPALKNGLYIYHDNLCRVLSNYREQLSTINPQLN